MASFPKGLAAVAAGCAVFSVAPAARADHAGDMVVLLGGTPLAQSALLSGYISVGVYAYNSDERMPVAWTVMNSITGAMGGSFGIFQFAVGISESTGSSDRKQLRPLNMAGGALCVIGSAVVVTGTILQTMRPKAQQKAEPIFVIPMPITTGAGTSPGLMAIGRF